MATTTLTRPERVAAGRLWWAGPLAAIVASIANLVIYVIAVAAGVSMLVPGPDPSLPPQPLPIPAVVLFSAIPALVAAGLLALLGRFTARPIRIFLIIAAVVLVLSFIPPLLIPISLGLKITFEIMHIVAAAVIVGVLTLYGRAA
jgi:uncharacterized membrane protein YphA (DoxX/SURF4 family)